MDLMQIILTIILGGISGILGGALGLGGSFIMLPGVILLNIIPNYKTAVGTILFSMLPPISILAVYDYYKRKQVNFTVGTILFVSYFLASYLGAILNGHFSSKVLEYASALCFISIGIYFFYQAYTSK
jgi:uncharacterized membrane protein YfcA